MLYGATRIPVDAETIVFAVGRLEPWSAWLVRANAFMGERPGWDVAPALVTKGHDGMYSSPEGAM